MPTKSKIVFREAKENAYSPPESAIDMSVPEERQYTHHVIHNGKHIGTIHSTHYHQYGDIPTASAQLTFTNNKRKSQKYFLPNVNLYGNDEEGSHFQRPEIVAAALETHLNKSNTIPAHLKNLRNSGRFEVKNTEPELPLDLPHFAKEDVTELLRLAINEKPNAFREVFDEIMLAKIVDISDEMKDEIAQSMFGESSHEYGKGGKGKEKPHKKQKHNRMEESFEPEDEEEYEEEDEDFDISDEDLEDLDLDDEDFEDEEQIEEANMKRTLGDTPFVPQNHRYLSPEEEAKFLARAGQAREHIKVMKRELQNMGYTFKPPKGNS